MPPIKEINKGTFEFIHPRILAFTLAISQPSKKDILDYEQGMIEVMKEVPHNVVIIYDATIGEWASFETRTTFGQVVKNLDMKFRDRILTSHVVIPSTTIRLILRGINIVGRPLIKQSIHNSRKEAESAALLEVSTWDELKEQEL